MVCKTQASTCLVICIGKLMFAKIVKMQMSKKRQELLALSERPEQVEPWMQWRDLDDLLCFQNSSQFNMKSQAPSWFVVCLHCYMFFNSASRRRYFPASRKPKTLVVWQLQVQQLLQLCLPKLRTGWKCDRI